MKKYGITTPQKFVNLCISHDWLADATYSQLTKVYDANKAGCTIEIMTLLIWMCSPDTDIMDIKESLKQAHKEYIISEEC